MLLLLYIWFIFRCLKLGYDPLLGHLLLVPRDNVLQRLRDFYLNNFIWISIQLRVQLRVIRAYIPAHFCRKGEAKI